MLIVEGLVAGYGRLEVLHGVTMTVPPAAAVAVVGANGAGKSTLCRAISGLVPARGGHIYFDGVDISRFTTVERVRRGIVQVPEGRRVFPRMTVLENLRLGAYVHGEPGADALGEVFALFPILQARLSQQAGLLSGGEQQMLAIGRAMMGRPALLVLDEPSQGLSPKAVGEVARALSDIRQRGIAILLVEQNLGLAEQVAEYAYMLETGRCAAYGPATEMLDSAKVAASYLGH
jgi:branched-chain amino acid transport system ATP-binding protein